jgi:hypothetical protein
MRKTLLAAAALSAILIAGPSFAATSTDSTTDTSYDAKDNGGYVAKEKSETTDAAGTTTKHTAKKSVSVDDKGNKSTTVKIKSSTDPKGLMNKTTTETTNTAKETEDGTKYSHKKTVNGKTVEENSDEQTQ